MALRSEASLGVPAPRNLMAISKNKAMRRLYRRDGWKKAKARIMADKDNGLYDDSGYDCVLSRELTPPSTLPDSWISWNLAKRIDDAVFSTHTGDVYIDDYRVVKVEKAA